MNLSGARCVNAIMKTLLLAALVAALIAVAGAQALAATKTVRIGNNFFRAKAVSIHRGTRLTWRWSTHGVTHNVTVRSGPQRFRSGNRRRGTFSHTFTKRGTYKIVCTIHSSMRMTVRVS
jgi:plastocyanin